MPIVMFLGKNVKGYFFESKEKTKGMLQDNPIMCALCLSAMALHSSYRRRIKESGEEIRIYVVWCSKCKVWHALLPDFLLPNKHYSGNEIESVIIDSATQGAIEIDTKAHESTVSRWIKDIGGRIRGAIGKLKVLFGQAGHAICEIAIEPGPCYSELEQVLEMAPSPIACSGNKLGMANIWLGAILPPSLI